MGNRKGPEIEKVRENRTGPRNLIYTEPYLHPRNLIYIRGTLFTSSDLESVHDW